MEVVLVIVILGALGVAVIIQSMREPNRYDRTPPRELSDVPRVSPRRSSEQTPKVEPKPAPKPNPYTPPTTPPKARQTQVAGKVSRKVAANGTTTITYERRMVVTETVVSACEPIVGRAWVVDGDTIKINNQQIRLYGIDAPEMEHPYGPKSKWAMVALCKGQEITAIPDGSSSHDRCVARCYLPDGRDLSAELVKQGLAIDWPKFSGGEYTKFEAEGVRKKLWRAHNRQVGKYVPPYTPKKKA